MKLHIPTSLHLAACGLLLILSACKGGDDTTLTQPSEQETLVGSKEKPDWQNPAEQDMTASMTALVRVNLSLSYPKQMEALGNVATNGQIAGPDDMLAAFSGETCLGVATFVDGLFFLYISKPPKGVPLTIELRYYSAKLKNIFVAKEACTFVADTCLGSASVPLEPKFYLTY